MVHNARKRVGETLESRPTRGQVAAARLILKRKNEGKGNVVITPRIKRLAEYRGFETGW